MLWHFCAFTGRQINQRHSSFFVIQEKTGFLKWSSLMWGMISKLQSQDGLRSTKAHPPSHKYVGRYVYTSCNHTDTPELPNWIRNDSRWLMENWTPPQQRHKRGNLAKPNVQATSYWFASLYQREWNYNQPQAWVNTKGGQPVATTHYSDQTGGFISVELVSSSSST